MSLKYRNLLSPIKIGNVILKNRMLSTNALPHFLQGPELYPADPVISHYASLAKNGAAIVTCSSRLWRGPAEDMKRGALYDIAEPSCHNYISQMAETIHFYGSKASIAIMLRPPEGFSVSPSDGDSGPGFLGSPAHGPQKELADEQIEELIAQVVGLAKFYQAMGFDMMSIHMSYQATILAHFLSPIVNKRTDKYGGPIENRARFPLALCERIKQACGRNFLIEAQVSGEDDWGFTTADLAAFARLAQGKVDILQLRAANASLSHPVGFNSLPHKPLTLRYAEVVKASGANIVTAPCGGFQDLDDCEAFVAGGKTDMIAMGRAFICDPQFGIKAYAGTGEDVVPCIRCDRCHVVSMSGPWISVCSVNPTLGFAHKLDRMVTGPTDIKKVAVVGGGPAGMKAALVAAQRGHKVNLYEKNDYLGGQLRHADFASFKWPLRNFKDYLIRQLDKRGVRVFLGTEATPDMIRSGGYDAVILAVGAKPNVPDVPGADGPYVWAAIDVFGREAELGKNVVVVGGSETGAETGLYLAQNGHNVTILTRQKKLASTATPIHYIEMFQEAWEALDNFSYITEVTTTAIADGQVAYQDTAGNVRTITADSVVLSGGMNPCQDEAMAFAGTADLFYVAGDCSAVGNVQKAIRSAYTISSML